jgi:hypothetical protein
MTWTTNEIIIAILQAIKSLNGENAFIFAEFDDIRGVGVGVRNSEQLVLMLPSEPAAEGFVAKYAEYQPAIMLVQGDKSEELVEKSVLTCTVSPEDLSQIQAVASIFSGLLSLQLGATNLSSAIWALRGLFENGFKTGAGLETVKGLIGELCVIADYHYDSKLISAWHTQPSDKFDFSFSNERIEVKTTSGAVRIHKFSEGQVPGPKNVNVYVASVKLQVVETGGFSLADHLLFLKATIPLADFERVLEIATQYLGENPLSVFQPRYDLPGTLGNIAYFHGALVPYPSPADGTSEISWKANLEGMAALQSKPRTTA